jgi:hypothetical protein
MFGHQDQPAVGGTNQDGVDASVDAMLSDNSQGASFPPSGESSVVPPDTMTTMSSASNPPVPTVVSAAQPSVTPGLGTDNSADDDDTTSATAALPTSSYTDDLTSTDQSLLTLKQNALQQLRPLVDHLDQTPEEKFRTTMMMIQGADDQSLIQTAYEAAQQITDEKTRAQALLDVVNEINYFTHK